MNKKIYIIFIISFMLLTGCSKKMTCEYKYDGTGYEYNSKIVLKVKKDKVISSTATLNYAKEDTAKYMCEVFKASSDASNDLKCKGKTIKINNYHKSVSDEDMTKDEFIKYLENQKFTCDK